jgi:hypothetical protein
MLRPTVSRPVCLMAPIWGLRPDFYSCQTVAGLLMWGALTDERTDLSFTIAAGPREGSHSRVRVPWDSRPYFTLSDSRLPFSSPPTIRRATVEVFDLASTRDSPTNSRLVLLITYWHGPRNRFPLLLCPIAAVETCLFAKPLLGNGSLCWLHSFYIGQICHNINVHRTGWCISRNHSSLIEVPC